MATRWYALVLDVQYIVLSLPGTIYDLAWFYKGHAGIIFD